MRFQQLYLHLIEILRRRPNNSKNLKWTLIFHRIQCRLLYAIDMECIATSIILRCFLRKWWILATHVPLISLHPSFHSSKMGINLFLQKYVGFKYVIWQPFFFLLKLPFHIFCKSIIHAWQPNKHYMIITSIYDGHIYIIILHYIV